MTDSPTDSITGLMPTPLPAGLRDRMLHAMEEAGQETREDLDMECLLARMQPTPLPTEVQMRSTTHMQKAQSSTNYRPYSKRKIWRISAAAGILMLGIWGVSTSLQSISGAEEPQGLVRRSVLERTGGDTVQWESNDTPMFQYDVMYEDSFVLTGEDDTTLVIRVPNRTTVSVRGEVI